MPLQASYLSKKPNVQWIEKHNTTYVCYYCIRISTFVNTIRQQSDSYTYRETAIYVNSPMSSSDVVSSDVVSTMPNKNVLVSIILNKAATPEEQDTCKVL